MAVDLVKGLTGDTVGLVQLTQYSAQMLPELLRLISDREKIQQSAVTALVNLCQVCYFDAHLACQLQCFIYHQSPLLCASRLGVTWVIAAISACMSIAYACCLSAVYMQTKAAALTCLHYRL